MSDPVALVATVAPAELAPSRLLRVRFRSGKDMVRLDDISRVEARNCPAPLCPRSIAGGRIIQGMSLFEPARCAAVRVPLYRQAI